MSTKIDGYLNDYMQTLLQENMIDIENVKILIDKVREAYKLTGLFFVENDHYMYSLTHTYTSISHGIIWDNTSIHLQEKEYQHIMHRYDENGLSTERYLLKSLPGALLHCGMIANDYMYGMIGFYDENKNRVWSEEEKTALLKLTRAIFFYVEQKRRKVGKEQDFTFHSADVVRVNASEYYINLNEDTCHGFKIKGLMKNVFPEWSKYSETISGYCDNYVSPGYDKNIRAKFSLNGLKNSLSLENPEIKEEHPITIDDTTYWLRLTAKLMDVNEEGKPNHVILITEDITEDISEKDRSYYNFRLLQETFYQIFSVNLDTDRYTYLKKYEDKNFLKIPENGNYTIEIGKVEENDIHPNDREKFHTAWSKDTLIKRFDKSLKTISVDYRRKINGKYQWVRAEFVPSRTYGPGERHAIVYLKDISDEMGKQEEQMSIISSLTKIYYTTYYISMKDDHIVNMRTLEDIQNIAVSENHATPTLCKLAREYATEAYLDKLLEFVDMTTIKERLHEHKMLSFEYLSRNDGWVRAHFIPVQWDDNGDITHVLYAKAHIDEEKRKDLDTRAALKDAYEAATRANSAKTEFLSRVSHDIRTPMNAIIGMTAIAAAYIEDKERVQSCLTKITSSSRHLLTLINEVLDMSKIESGNIEITEENFNLSELIENIITIVNPLVAQQGHSLKVHLQNLKHENVIGDSLRIQQVFMNILSNSVKYTPEGGEICLSICETPSRQAKIANYQFVFQDNGIGMSEEFLQHIFEPFTREEDSRTNTVQGTGLGMPIVHNIIKMMGGEIKVESKKGVGSKFTVNLQMKLQEKEADDNTDLAGLPVLVADDDQVVCESTCVILNEIGMQGTWVNNGPDAVSKTYEAHRAGDDFFAVILDWKMPGMDGIETARQIRKKVGPTVPIIVLTAYDWTKIEMEARAAGVNAFLPKPMFKTSLIRLFHQLKDGEQDNDKVESANILKEHIYTNRRVLVVEDQEFNREISRVFLNMAGVQVEEAENGLQAVTMVENSKENYYDLIFMDIQMPVMNGYDATRAIRALHRKDVETMPIIAMTANAFADDIHNAKIAGMNEHIAKPIELPKFKAVLEQWLDHKGDAKA